MRGRGRRRLRGGAGVAEAEIGLEVLDQWAHVAGIDVGAFLFHFSYDGSPARERMMRHGDAVECVAILAGSFDDLFAGAIRQFFRAEGVEIYRAGRLRGNLRWGGRLRRSVARSRGACGDTDGGEEKRARK